MIQDVEITIFFYYYYELKSHSYNIKQFDFKRWKTIYAIKSQNYKITKIEDIKSL